MSSDPGISTTGIAIVSVADAPWSDVERVFGTRGDPSTCWCQYFRMPNAELDAAPRGVTSGLLRSQTEANDPAPGLIAYLDGEPVGWCAIEPRQRYPRVLRSKVAADSADLADDSSVWAVTCFVVRVGFRRRGISTALVAAAVGWARDHGARVIEGYPVDAAARAKPSAAELYHGTLTLFELAGFVEVSRPTPSRALMRLEL